LQRDRVSAPHGLTRYSPQVVKANVLEPLELGAARFDSVGLNGVLHCLPGTLETKAAVFQNLKPFVEQGGVVFGSTIPRARRRAWSARTEGAPALQP
jgi:hypothetical protein